MNDVKRWALCPYNDSGCFSPHMAELHTLPCPEERQVYWLESDAQVELAALREELAECNKRKAWWVESAKTLDERLTAAEQRNAGLRGLLREVIGVRHDDGLAGRIEAALKPTESGASE